MANKRHEPAEIVRTLRHVHALVGQGMARVDAIREVRNPPLSGWQRARHRLERR
ncbi:MAG: hypothetical protein NXH97_00010 [Rhodobacteraceae bacterium]|nr:hypothetical protein [Paracoccaceae bacterium]